MNKPLTKERRREVELDVADKWADVHRVKWREVTHIWTWHEYKQWHICGRPDDQHMSLGYGNQ